MMILLFIVLAPIVYLLIGAVVAGIVLYVVDGKNGADIGGGCIVMVAWPIFVLIAITGLVIDILGKVFK